MCVGQLWDAFYVVEHDNGDRLKFGITSGSGRVRLADHARNGYTRLVLLRTGLPDGIAAETESAVRSALALAGERPIKGREYFDAGTLGLVMDIASNYLVPEVAV